jgi:tRNA(Glu) U13 pseudouridine synthase TruD
MRMLWLHAYQSKLWNILATERVRIGRSNRDPFAALPGDLVRVRTQTAGQSSSGSVMVEEKDSVMRLGANNSCASATADDKYTLQDVLLPVLGRGSELPATEFGG